MAKSSTRYVCSACGSVSPKWSGKCDGCGEWNTLSEEASPSLSTPGKKAVGRRVKLETLTVPDDQPPLTRHISKIEELDRVIGGGVVPGSAVLIGGIRALANPHYYCNYYADLRKMDCVPPISQVRNLQNR